jgi:hypothetical protein
MFLGLLFLSLSHVSSLVCLQVTCHLGSSLVGFPLIIGSQNCIIGGVLSSLVLPLCSLLLCFCGFCIGSSILFFLFLCLHTWSHSAFSMHICWRDTTDHWPSQENWWTSLWTSTVSLTIINLPAMQQFLKLGVQFPHSLSCKYLDLLWVRNLQAAFCLKSMCINCQRLWKFATISNMWDRASCFPLSLAFQQLLKKWIFFSGIQSDSSWRLQALGLHVCK